MKKEDKLTELLDSLPNLYYPEPTMDEIYDILWDLGVKLEPKPLRRIQLEASSFKKVYICDKNNVNCGFFGTILSYSHLTDTLYLTHDESLMQFSSSFYAYTKEKYEKLRNLHPDLGGWEEDKEDSQSIFHKKYVAEPIFHHFLAQN